MIEKTLAKKRAAIRDKDILFLLDNPDVSEDEANKIFYNGIIPKGYYYKREYDKTAALKKFISAHENALRILFGDYFDDCAALLLCKQWRFGDYDYYINIQSRFTELVWFACSAFDPSDPLSEDNDKVTSRVKYYFCDKALKEGKADINDYVAACRKYPCIFNFCKFLLAKYCNENAYGYLIEPFENASLEDSIRISVINAVYSCGNRYLEERFTDYALEKRLYKLPCFHEGLPFVYEIKKNASDILAIIGDALRGKTEDYLTKPIADVIVFLHTLYVADYDEYINVIKKYISAGGTARKSALYAVGSYSQNQKEFINEIIGNADAEDYAYFMNSYDPENDDRETACALARDLFRIYDGMKKSSVTYHNPEMIGTSSLNKEQIIRYAVKAVILYKNAELLAELERRYDEMPTSSKAEFLEAFGIITSLDARRLAIRFLKTDNYEALSYYNGAGIKLTYAEAEETFAYLHSKRSSVRSKLITEYLNSLEKEKICDALCASDDYALKEAGEEMRDKLGYKEDNRIEEKAKKEFSAILASPPEFVKIKRLTDRKLTELFAEISKFITAHADCEYETRFSDFTTLSNEYGFYNMLKGATDQYSCDSYPFGKEFCDIIRNTVKDDELCDLTVIGKTEKQFTKVKETYGINFCDNKTYEVYTKLSQKYPVVKRIIDTLSEVALLSADPEIIAAHISASVPDANGMLEKAFKQKRHNRFDNYNWIYPSVFNDVLTKKHSLSDDKYRYCFALIALCGAFNMTSDCACTAYERGLVTDNIIKFLCLNGRLPLFSFTNEENKLYLLREVNYPYPKFATLMRGFINESALKECGRKTLDTSETEMLKTCSAFFGVGIYIAAANALTGKKLIRGSYGFCYDSTQEGILSHILARTVRTKEDDYGEFENAAKRYGIKENDLIRATLYNPVYLDFADKYLNIKGFSTAVCYFMAHLNEELTEWRKEMIKKYSSVPPDDFKDGAFDREWYEKVKQDTDKKYLDIIRENGKYITVANLHKRAQRFFDAADGKLAAEECEKFIVEKRSKDYLLAYGIVPLASAEEAEKRYVFINRFLADGKAFGIQRQASERRCAEIALDNLARTAGYADTKVFVYETEARNPCDIFVPRIIGDYEVKAEMTIKNISLSATKNGKKVSLPASLAKEEQVKNLKEKIAEEKERLKRTRGGLEECMCNGTVFTAKQLALISSQPVIAYLLERLVFLAEGKTAYLSGGELYATDGNKLDVATAEIAHPVKLAELGLLKEATDHIIKNNIVQPFKQVFREIYTVNEDEKNANELLRFKGFEVSLKKCVSALKTRKWGYSPDVGMRRVFYNANTVCALFREFDLPYLYDWDNDMRELYGAEFYTRNDGRQLDLKDVDSVAFSEACRDIDLVVAISATNVYDFRFATSTAQVRKNMLESLCDILHLNNVGFLKHNITIKGYYGNYTINMRTGLVFKEGVGNLAIATVHTSHKPILLDFIDEDPMTLDIVSKALVLSDDKNIKDPALLREIENR